LAQMCYMFGCPGRRCMHSVRPHGFLHALFEVYKIQEWGVPYLPYHNQPGYPPLSGLSLSSRLGKLVVFGL
ncbi:hypothetical protein BAE44_0003492, partial [Dichanthelium oligosanthes]